jgi:hypothetical protein
MEMMAIRLLAIGCIASVLGAANAQAAPSEGRAVAWTAVQGQEIKTLADHFVGTWKSHESFEANKFLKSGLSGAGVFVVRVGPGGNSVIFDYKSKSAMGDYSSVRTIYWDTKAKAYRAFYCDSLQPTGCGEVGTGNWRGGDLVFETSTMGPDGVMRTRETFKLSGRDRYTFSLDLLDGVKANRSLTIESVRAAD